MESSERDALILLNLAPGLGPTLTRRCLDAFGSPAAVVGASAHQLARVEGIGGKRASDIRVGLDDLEKSDGLARELELIERHGVTLLALDDPGYPALLKHIHDPPPLLYVRGELRREDSVALAVVGSRKCSHYGREQADRLAAACAQAGLCIVSGGAFGVDAAAHRAALRVKGRTIAVLGNGIAEPYPRENAELFGQIATSGGAVISEMPMSTPPLRENFPRRNRIISGLSLGVLVIEASTQSGALITARLASEEHNREVLALPGKVDSPTSAGCHKIIREGWATLVTNLADILDALGDAGQTLKGAVMAESPASRHDASAGLLDHSLTDKLTENQKRVVEAMAEPAELDRLAAATGLAVHVIQADLTLLQIRGLVEKRGPLFARRR